MSKFVQLTSEDCTYLLTLIEEMDADTAYTARQRAYTVPKLERIRIDPRSARLASQDVTYLLELIEDDEVEELMQQRIMTQVALEEIRALQDQKFQALRDVEEQREQRRRRRAPVQALQEHFEHTQA